MTVGTYAINWSDTQVGNDLVFPSLGFTIEHTDIPSGVGANGSLKWPPFLGDSANVFVTLTLTLASAGTVSFQWRADGEAGTDGGRFYIDGIQQDTRLGTTAWASSSTSVSSGTHTFKWAYTSDGSVTAGQQTLWLAMLSITNVTDPPPVTVSTNTPIVYDMEDGALPSIVTGDWTNSTSSPITGTRSLRSPVSPAASADHDTVWTFSALPEVGVFRFKWKRDSESGTFITGDPFGVYVGASLVASSFLTNTDSGDMALVVPAGTTSITHRFRKDGAVNVGADACWVDDVSIAFQVAAAAPPSPHRATIVASRAAQRASRW